MSVCKYPFIINVLAAAAVVAILVAISWAICALFYYAGYGYSAKKRADKEGRK